MSTNKLDDHVEMLLTLFSNPDTLHPLSCWLTVATVLTKLFFEACCSKITLSSGQSRRKTSKLIQQIVKYEANFNILG